MRKIILAGNPNVGKSVIFNVLTGTYNDVANYPGTTLDVTCIRFGQDILSDTPGIYGLSSFNEEERIARDIILQSDIVINVVDSVHLDRDLFLTQQIIDTGIPVIVALNMFDEARRYGLEIDIKLLERLLGVPVVPTVAVGNKGIDKLKTRLNEARTGKIDPELVKLLDKAPAGVSQGEYLLVLEGDAEVAGRCGLPPGNLIDEIYNLRRKRVNQIANQVVNKDTGQIPFSTMLGRLLIQPITGIPILILTLLAMYQLIGVLIAQNVVGYTEEVIMGGYYEPAVRSFVGQYIKPESFLGIILTGQFGVLTMAVTLIFGLLLPLVAGFFLVFSLVEDSGYLPRIATLLDRMLLRMGLNGQAVIPFILGFGCVTMAAITTRLLGSDREKRIAIFLLCLGIPCSAQLAVITTLLVSLGGQYVLLFILIIFSIFIAAGSLLGRYLPGQSSPLFIELPPLRLPSLTNVFTKTWNKTYNFILEAIPLFVGGALLLGILEATGALKAVQNALVPLIVGWLNLPKETAASFLMGFIRRDFGTAGIMSLSMLPVQKFVALVTLTLFVPCIASAMVLFKERGWREGLIMWLTVIFLAFFIGGTLAHLFEFFSSMGGSLTIPLVAGAVMLMLIIALVFSHRKSSVQI
ncbi:ferrous iron transport protein B [Desulfolucanica intricata]|uniref:ferrous iron transport protein B n=1 Tax=Desulfolucanica intricata TaxID=1285191 RepID=UPI00082EB095|nr:ferrous iron transport protein B [Desulfolucanica intricata]